MLHIPPHKNLAAPAGQYEPLASVVCRSCGGEGHHGNDECGRWYSCFACCASGYQRMPMLHAEADDQAELIAEFAAQRAREEWEASVARRREARRIAAGCDFDDIPF